MIALDPKTTALVLIDLQKGVVGRDLSPHPGTAVLKTVIGLADRFRAEGALVVLVNVAFSPDGKDALRQPVDQPSSAPPGGWPPDWTELSDGLPKPGDIRITKRQWGAFYGTEMDLALRRRGIRSLVMGGIATNMGVESTARQAWEHGYALLLPEDLSTSFSAEMHDFAMKKIFPRIGRVVRTADLSFGV